MINKSLRRSLFILVLCSVYVQDVSAQGCSDAGFCSIDGINPNQQLDTVKTLNQRFSAGFNYGVAQFGVRIISTSLGYDVSATENLKLSFKITHASISGDLGSNSGLSDFFASFSYKLSKEFSLINGVKTPFSIASDKNLNREMPHSYQTSLGTVDYLTGLSWRKNKLLISLGAQIPLLQNQNSFFLDEFTEDELNPGYSSTNRFVRSADVIFRFNYKVPMFSDKIKLTVGLLPIYHLKNDTYINRSGIEEEIVGSKGLTLNVNGVLQYSINQKNNFEFTFGVPAKARKRRPDGLAQMALNIQYNYRFGG